METFRGIVVTLLLGGKGAPKKKIMTLKLKRGGFSLVEVIGVLAIMAIIAALVAPKVIDQIHRSVREAEQDTLKSLVQGLEQYILLERKIPGNTASGGVAAWDDAIASQINLPASKVNTNERGYNRYYIFPDNDNSSTSSIENNPNLPYNQTAAGATALDAAQQEIRPRMIVLSSISSNISGLSSGEMASMTNFNVLWNWDGNSAISGPFTMSADVAKRNLVIQRYSTAALFHEVSLLSRSVSRTGNGFMAQNVSSSPRNLLSAPNYTTLTSLSIQSDSFGTGVTLKVGCTGDNGCSSTYFYSGLNISTGFSGTSTAADLVINTSDTIITSDIAGGTTSNAGYISVTVEYQATSQYDLDDSGTSPNFTNVAPGAAGEVSLFVIQGTKLSLYDNNPTSPLLLHTVFINSSDSFWFSPGPPAAWGR